MTPEQRYLAAEGLALVLDMNGDAPAAELVRDLVADARSLRKQFEEKPPLTTGGLTERQRECLLFIIDTVDESGVAPSYDEIMWGLGLRSKSGIHRLVDALEERGFIRRIPARRRAIEVLRRPA